MSSSFDSTTSLRKYSTVSRDHISNLQEIFTFSKAISNFLLMTFLLCCKIDNGLISKELKSCTALCCIVSVAVTFLMV